jgi:hypothetical protein
MERGSRIVRRERRRIGPAIAGTIAAVGVVWSGVVLVGGDGQAGVDMSREETFADQRGDVRVDGTTTGADRRPLPETAPFVPDGFVLEYTIRANTAQAAAYGVDAERARSWGFVRDGGATDAAQAVTDAVRNAGGSVTKRPGAPDSEFVGMTGTWNGLIVAVGIHAESLITISLIDAG